MITKELVNKLENACQNNNNSEVAILLDDYDFREYPNLSYSLILKNLRALPDEPSVKQQLASLEIVSTLISRGAKFVENPGAEDNPVFYAAAKNMVTVLQFLIIKIPSNLLNAYGQKALSVAIDLDHCEIVKLLVNSLILPEQRSFYLTAYKTDSFETFQKIIDQCPDLTQIEEETGKTVLHYAIEVGAISKVKYLLDKKPELATIARNSSTLPLQYATQCVEDALNTPSEIERRAIRAIIEEKTFNQEFEINKLLGVIFFVLVFLNFTLFPEQECQGECDIFRPSL